MENKDTKNPAPLTSSSAPRTGSLPIGQEIPNDGKPSGRTHAEGPDHAARDQSNDQKVSVKARRTFHKEANMQGDLVHEGHEFETTRERAAQLRANGLIDYSDEGDEKELHGRTQGDALREAIKRDEEMRKIPEQHKTSPLRNPEIKYAEPAGDVRKGKGKGEEGK